MSIYPSPDQLDAKESKYALVILAAKRARQIKDNARRLTDSKSANPLTVALEEIAAGAVIERVVEDSTVTAAKAALKPTIPSLEDIIGAGPVIALEPEADGPAAQLAAFRNAEPDSDDDDMTDDERVLAVDTFALEAPSLISELDEEEDDLIPELDEDDE